MSSILQVLKLSIHPDHIDHPLTLKCGRVQLTRDQRIKGVALLILVTILTVGIGTLFCIGAAYWKHRRVTQLRREFDAILKEPERLSKLRTPAPITGLINRINALSKSETNKEFLHPVTQRLCSLLGRLESHLENDGDPNAREWQIVTSRIRLAINEIFDERPVITKAIADDLVKAVKADDYEAVSKIVRVYKPSNDQFLSRAFSTLSDRRIFKVMFDNVWGSAINLYALNSMTGSRLGSNDRDPKLVEEKEAWKTLVEAGMDLNEIYPLNLRNTSSFATPFVCQQFIDNGGIINIENGQCPYLDLNLDWGGCVAVFLFNGAIPSASVAEEISILAPEMLLSRQEALGVDNEASMNRVSSVSAAVAELNQVNGVKDIPPEVLKIVATYNASLSIIAKSSDLRARLLKRCWEIQEEFVKRRQVVVWENGIRVVYTHPVEDLPVRLA